VYRVITDILIIGAGCAALGLGAGWLVEAGARIAKRMGVSELVVGLTVVAFASSAPEFVVTVWSALRGHPDISVSNIVGSNIFNIGFILGGCAVVYSVKTTSSLVWRDGMILLGVTLLLFLPLSDLVISRLEGGLMVILLLFYLALLYRVRETPEEVPAGAATWKDAPLLLAGVGLIVGGGHFLVEAAVELARMAGMKEWAIGVTIVAAGTSVPELATSVTALMKKHHSISAGNLIGSNIFNTLGVLGISGTLRPLAVDPSAISSVAVLVALTGAVVVFMRSRWRVSRVEGAILMAMGAAFWLYDLIGLH